MNTFEDIKSQWNTQIKPETPMGGSETILEKTNFLKRKQWWANGILALTTLILISFFFYISAFKNQTVSLALGLMIMSLILRISLEIFSISRLKALNFSENASKFKTRITAYYKNRIYIHYIMTPIIIGAYSVGFIVLLPFFKQSLSSGFYLYIKISAVVILVVLSLFIAKQIQKEIITLKALKN